MCEWSQRRKALGAALGALGLLAASAGAVLPAHAAEGEGCITAECHAALAQLSAPHGPLHEGKCSPCHQQADPKHPSKTKNFRFVHGGGKDLCFGCHLDFGAGLANSKHFHSPVAQGDCEGCHVPHGSQYGRLLAHPYRAEVTLPFSPANYALCWDCHNQALVLLETTKKISEFRNGSRNLHWAHVNRSPAGTGCRACHMTHGSSQSRLVRQTSPFADAWAPIRTFAATPSGGRCDSTCHGLRSYDRESAATGY